MSLKDFHLLFISASGVLGVLVGIWGVQRYLQAGSIEGLGLGALFLSMTGVLVLYRARFLAKLARIESESKP